MDGGRDTLFLQESQDGDHGKKKKKKKNATTGASAAGIRALSAQMLSFYFRAPIKAFFRTRVE